MSQINVIITVYHDGVKSYFTDLLDSIIQQTSNDFELYVFNDSSQTNIISTEYSNKLEYEVIELPKLSITENRIWIFNYLKSINLKNVHLVDADDTIEPNYIDKSEELLKTYDIICHDFNLVDENLDLIEKNYWKPRFKSPDDEISQEFIYNKNIIGLGNTSFKKKILNGNEIKYSDLVAIPDWFIFFQIVYNSNFKIGFTSKAIFNYRQHSNLAKLLETDYDVVNEKINQVKNHYQALSSIGINEFEDYINRFEQLLLGLTIEFYYLYIAQRTETNYFWWEEIFKILEYYENRDKK
jgi:hypothetical protein